MDKYCVTAKQAASLQSILKRELPLLPEIAIRQALKKRDVRVNGTRVNTNVMLNIGDEVVLFTAHPMKEVPVIYQDEEVLIINKPAGLNSDEHEATSFSVLDWVKLHHPTDEDPSLVHRLDNQTSGLMIIARNEKARIALEDDFRLGRVIKQYTALIAGSPRPEKAVMTAWLVKDAGNARVSIHQKELPAGRKIITEYDTIQSGAVSRLLVTLHTGRTHQIRAHLAFLGHPVLGDEVYGSREVNRNTSAKGLQLCATGLSFHPGCGLQQLQGKRFEIAPPF